MSIVQSKGHRHDFLEAEAWAVPERMGRSTDSLNALLGSSMGDSSASPSSVCHGGGSIKHKSNTPRPDRGESGPGHPYLGTSIQGSTLCPTQQLPWWQEGKDCLDSWSVAKGHECHLLAPQQACRLPQRAAGQLGVARKPVILWQWDTEVAQISKIGLALELLLLSSRTLWDFQ